MPVCIHSLLIFVISLIKKNTSFSIFSVTPRLATWTLDWEWTRWTRTWACLEWAQQRTLRPTPWTCLTWTRAWAPPWLACPRAQVQWQVWARAWRVWAQHSARAWAQWRLKRLPWMPWHAIRTWTPWVLCTTSQISTDPATLKRTAGATRTPSRRIHISPWLPWPSSNHQARCSPSVRSTSGSWTCSPFTDKTSNAGRTPSATRSHSTIASSKCLAHPISQARAHSGPCILTRATCLRTAATCGARSVSNAKNLQARNLAGSRRNLVHTAALKAATATNLRTLTLQSASTKGRFLTWSQTREWVQSTTPLRPFPSTTNSSSNSSSTWWRSTTRFSRTTRI